MRLRVSRSSACLIQSVKTLFRFIAVPQIMRVMPAAVERFVVLPWCVAATLYHSQCRNRQLLIELCNTAAVATILDWHSLNPISIHLSP
jgi:hypothetical protein